jgi:chemotaxis protein CheD
MEQKTIVKIFQGGCYVTANSNEIVSTILGSCIAACIRCPDRKFGGMNHFLLPGTDSDREPNSKQRLDSDFLRYGSFAMEQLINEILAKGAKRANLEAKIFGGGNVLDTGMNIGHRNADFVEDFLLAEGISIVSSNVRGTLPRSVRYYPSSGKVLMNQINAQNAQVVVEQETNRKLRIRKDEGTGTIELFD